MTARKCVHHYIVNQVRLGVCRKCGTRRQFPDYAPREDQRPNKRKAALHLASNNTKNKSKLVDRERQEAMLQEAHE